MSFEDRIRLIPAVDAIKKRAAKERHEVGVKKGGKPAHQKLDAKANSGAPVRQSKRVPKSSDSTASELDLGSRTVDNFRHLQQYPEICNDFRERRIGWKEARRRAKIADRENRIRVR